jgi:hypothetical protein
MHQFFDAAPVAPSLTSVYEHRPIPPSRLPRRALVESEQQLVPVKENYVSVDSPPTNETRNRRRLAMTAAAVVAVIGVAAIAINRMNSDDDVEPAPAVQPTATPTTATPTTATPTTATPTTVTPTTAAPTTVAPTPVGPTTGTFVMPGVDLTFAVPAGWAYYDDWYVAKPLTYPIFSVSFNNVANIYTDSCPSVPVDPPVGPTVDDLASAWANLPGLNATAASDITVDGYHGKQVEFTVPDYNEDDCPYGDFKLLGSVGGGAYWAQGPNQHHRLWILDVNGTRLVILATSFPDTTPQERAELDEILASIQID